MKPKTYLNLINGKWIKSGSGKTFADINPANSGEVVGFFQESTPSDLEKAVSSAATAFDKWRLSSLAEREQIFRKAAVIMEEKKEELAAELTREEGKTLDESRK